MIAWCTGLDESPSFGRKRIARGSPRYKGRSPQSLLSLRGMLGFSKASSRWSAPGPEEAVRQIADSYKKRVRVRSANTDTKAEASKPVFRMRRAMSRHEDKIR